MPRPRYKRKNRTPAPPLVLNHPPIEFIQPNPDSEVARKIEAKLEENAARISQAAGPDVWVVNGRTR